MLLGSKPPACSGCNLSHLGHGFIRPSGPPGARVLLLGESAGAREIEAGLPFVGPAGGKLSHLLYRLSRSREEVRIANVISCRPPHDELEHKPWEDAILHCRKAHLDPILAEPHQVIVTLGGVPTRQLLRVGGNLKNFHGTVSEAEVAPGRKAWVVPTFHPSHLLRGANNLTGTVLFDLARAFRIAEEGWEPDTPTLHQDPPPAFLSAWVDDYLAAVAEDPLRVWLSVDVETPDKERKQDEGELKAADKSMEILRVNLACRLDEGLTVPFVGPYIPIIGRALASAGPKCFWNKAYDLKRLWAAYGVAALPGPLLDFMDAWHALHSDVPKGLGFVAPYYSKWGPWKHLSHDDPVLYAAGDALQNQRCAFGIAADLQSQGMWDVFFRHMHEVDRLATSPSCQVGLLLDPDRLEGMRVELKEKADGFAAEMQALVPEDLKPLHPKDGWAEAPTANGEGGSYVYPKPDDPKRGWRSRPRPVLEKLCDWTTKVCETCQEPRVTVKHRCRGADGRPVKGPNPAKVVEKALLLPRYFVREDFNPGSPQQVLAYIRYCKHKPGHEKGKVTVNRETIERLAEAKPKSKRDEAARDLYRLILDFREVKKILGTYVEGMQRRLAEGGDGRVHPVVTSNPSTLRTAYNSPNLQNVVADKRGKASLAAGFRKCVIAAPGCKLVEADWSGIEAVIVGWCMKDPDYIRLAWLGVHDFLCAAAIGKPAELSWPVDQLLAYFKEIKKAHPAERDQAKRIVHGTNYVESVEGIYRRFRKLFSSFKDAERLQDLYFAIAPKLRPWQQEVQDRAWEKEQIGGPGDHPYAYRHEFYAVRDFRPITEAEATKRRRFSLPTSFMNGRYYAVQPGDDAKRAVAFYGQAIAAGIIRETSLRLFTPGAPNYIGDLFHGQTPLRAIIHDSFFCEVPEENLQLLVNRLVAEMTRPILEMPMPESWGLGPYLQFGVEVKVGADWAGMEKVKAPQPWLAVLKGEAAGAAAGEVDLSDRAVVDETIDDQEEDEWTYTPDMFEFGGLAPAAARETVGDDIPF